MELPELIKSVLTEKLKNNSVVIFGLGQEGFSTYQTIRESLPDLKLVAMDDKPQEELSSNWQTVLTSDSALTFFRSSFENKATIQNEMGTSNTEITSSTRQISKLLEQPQVLVLKTPGIPFTHPLFSLLNSLKEKTITHSSNMELFLDILHGLPDVERPRTIGVTGTKGKSTTTALIFHVLKESGKAVFLAGNIGVPALEILKDLRAMIHSASGESSSGTSTSSWSEHGSLPTSLSHSFVVLELSSHQLQTLPYSPHIAVVQNITPEHLDYYKDFEEYVAAKAPISAHQVERDYIIYNPEYEIPSQFAANSKAQKLPFSLNLVPMTAESEQFLLKHPGEAQVVAFRKDDQLWYETESICSVTDLPLKGEHNILNSFPAIIVGKLLGIETEKITNAVKSFKSLPHRLEFVAEKNGVAYYNDSQGTTPEASIAAMRSFPGKEIILLAGGSDKGVSFTELAHEIVAQNVKHLILFSPTGEKIEAAVAAAGQGMTAATETSQSASSLNSNPVAWTDVSEQKSLPRIHHVSSMQEAVSLATKSAQAGTVVLLSPACASFGLFKNYQDRGNQFKEAVLKV